MANSLRKIDPISEKYFRPLEIADKCALYLFYFSAILSIITLFIDKQAYPVCYDVVQIGFVILVIMAFIVEQTIRLYLSPRAHNRRLKDFLSHAYNVPLSHEKTVGYYNSESSENFKRIAVQLLENCLFSKSIILEMARATRIKTILYSVVWLVAVLNRHTDLTIIAIIAQIIFSEQLAANYIRTEYLRMRFEQLYDDIYTLIQSKPKQHEFRVLTLQALVSYESVKISCSITLSKEIFERLNPILSKEWEKVKKALQI